MITVVQAWVKDSPNIVPIATLETRSITIARAVAGVFRRNGFRVESFQREPEYV